MSDKKEQIKKVVGVGLLLYSAWQMFRPKQERLKEVNKIIDTTAKVVEAPLEFMTQEEHKKNFKKVLWKW